MKFCSSGMLVATRVKMSDSEKRIVPDILKVSQISPVYKGGDATDPSNYRPIKCLSV